MSNGTLSRRNFIGSAALAVAAGVGGLEERATSAPASSHYRTFKFYIEPREQNGTNIPPRDPRQRLARAYPDSSKIKLLSGEGDQEFDRNRHHWNATIDVVSGENYLEVYWQAYLPLGYAEKYGANASRFRPRPDLTSLPCLALPFRVGVRSIGREIHAKSNRPNPSRQGRDFGRTFNAATQREPVLKIAADGTMYIVSNLDWIGKTAGKIYDDGKQFLGNRSAEIVRGVIKRQGSARRVTPMILYSAEEIPMDYSMRRYTLRVELARLSAAKRGETAIIELPLIFTNLAGETASLNAIIEAALS